MYYRLTYILTGLLLVLALPLAAQETEPETSESAPFTVEEGATVNLGNLEDEEEENERRPRRNEFYGLRTKPMFTTRGQGTGLIRENFYYLKEYQEPNTYLQQIYWYDFRKARIVTNGRIDPEFAGILHGPYRRYVGDSLVEEGQYYMGAKHGRWMEYDRNGVLLDKTKYFKGWLKESKLNYYDRRATKLREVLPIEWGEENGDYYMFHENGLLAVTGKYKFGHRVGVWREFYSHRRQIKREIQYPDDPWDWDRGFVPFILREYDERGRLIYDRDEFQRKIRPARRR